MAVLEHVLIIVAPTEAAAIAAKVEHDGSGTILGYAMPAETVVRQQGDHILIRAPGGLAALYLDAVGNLGWTTYGSGELFDGVPNHRGNRSTLRAIITERAYLLAKGPGVAAVASAIATINNNSTLFGVALTNSKHSGIRIPQNGPPHLALIADTAEIEAVVAMLPDTWVLIATGSWDNDDLPESAEMAYAWGYISGSN